jgi:hypothetical protein
MLSFKEYKILNESVDSKSLTKIIKPVLTLADSLGESIPSDKMVIFKKKIESITDQFVNSGSTEKSDIESFTDDVSEFFKEMKSEFLSNKNHDVSDIRNFSKENDKWRFSLMPKIIEKLESITNSQNIAKVNGKLITLEEITPKAPGVEKEYILKIDTRIIGSLGYGKSEVLKTTSLHKTKHSKEDYTTKKGWSASSGTSLNWASNTVLDSTKEKAIAKIL